MEIPGVIMGGGAAGNDDTGERDTFDVYDNGAGAGPNMGAGSGPNMGAGSGPNIGSCI